MRSLLQAVTSVLLLRVRAWLASRTPSGQRLQDMPGAMHHRNAQPPFQGKQPQTYEHSNPAITVQILKTKIYQRMMHFLYLIVVTNNSFNHTYVGVLLQHIISLCKHYGKYGSCPSKICFAECIPEMTFRIRIRCNPTSTFRSVQSMLSSRANIRLPSTLSFTNVSTY